MDQNLCWAYMEYIVGIYIYIYIYIYNIYIYLVWMCNGHLGTKWAAFSLALFIKLGTQWEEFSWTLDS